MVECLLENNVTVESLDLYDYSDDIPFYTHNRLELEQNDFYQMNKKKFMEADRLLLVFPVYWYSTPGIMKCWIDLITSYAYSYQKGLYAQPLHHIKKVMIVNLTMTSWWYNNFIWGNVANRQLKNTFRFLGIKSVDFYTVDKSQTLTPSVLKEHEKNLVNLAKSLIAVDRRS